MTEQVVRNEVLGKGAYGIVYAGEVSSLAERRKVAIKRLIKEDQIRFQSCIPEFDAAAYCRGHPFLTTSLKMLQSLGTRETEDTYAPDRPLTPLTDYDYPENSVDNGYHLVFERAEGGDLMQFYKAHPEIDFTNRVRFIHHLLCGLEWMHAHDMLHRDIKEINCLVFKEPNGSGWILKLTDYGLVKHNHPILPSSPCVYTTLYRPPEVVVHSESYDAKADMWAAGCAAYFILTGRHLFSELDDGRLLREILMVHDETIDSLDMLEDFYPLRDEDETKQQLKGVTLAAIARSKARVSFDEVAQAWPESFRDPLTRLLRGLLQLDPELRLSASDALDEFEEMFGAVGSTARERAASQAFEFVRPVEAWTGLRALPSDEARAQRRVVLEFAKVLLEKMPTTRLDARILVHAVDAFERYLVWKATPSASLFASALALLPADPRLVFLVFVNLFCKLFIVTMIFDIPILLEELEEMDPELAEQAKPYAGAQGPFFVLELAVLSDVFRFRTFVPTLFEAMMEGRGDEFTDSLYPLRVAETCLQKYEQLLTPEDAADCPINEPVLEARRDE